MSRAENPDQQAMPTADLPAITEQDLNDVGFPAGIKMAPGLALFMNDRIYRRCRGMSFDLARADGVMPPHLLNKPAAVFAIISISITWNLSPIMVARCTYQTPGGSLGYMGVLIQAILENSGRLEGGVGFELFGEWSRLQGRFKMMSGKGGKDYAAPDWQPKDEDGLGVRVFAKIKGQAEPLSEKFFLKEMHPRFSTLWATRPWQQIRYAAVRAFANIACPGILMGLPFDVDPIGFYGEPVVPSDMQDITPHQRHEEKPNEFARSPEQKQEPETKPEPKREMETVSKAVEQAGDNGFPDLSPQSGPQPDEIHQVKEALVQAGVAEVEREPTQEERAARRAQAFEDWYRDIKAEVGRERAFNKVTDLEQIYAPQLSGTRLKEWESLCEARRTAIMEAMRPKKR
jgi:hypothetical protein